MPLVMMARYSGRGCAAFPRFVDHGDGTVTDKLTGLMWIKGETVQVTWQSALYYVKTLNTGGHTDWRLPNVNELRSLVDYSQTEPSLPQGHPFTDVVASFYWSSTASTNGTGGAWGVDFGNGSVNKGKNADGYYVRAVRNIGSTGTSTILPTTTTTSLPETTTTTISISTTTTVPGNQCVAETIYGKDSEETELLREYRDKVLSKSATGRQMIKTYYDLSPAVVEVLQNNDTARASTRRVLDSLMPAIREKVKQ